MLTALLALALCQETVDAIMARVAENQERAVEARAAWVYDQNVFVRLNRGGGKLAREETRDYVVTPGPSGIGKELKRLSGKVSRGGKILEFSDPKEVEKNVDIDAEIAREISEEFSAAKNGKDGVSADLFPLTAGEQAKYIFQLGGREPYQDTEVYKITFEPKKGQEEGGAWSGEALIDVKEYQPLLVTTKLAMNIPLAVRVIFGSNIQHLGFKIAYQKVADGVWFPVRWGGEFKVRALFLYSRTIALAARNTEFRRTSAESTITFQKIPEFE